MTYREEHPRWSCTLFSAENLAFCSLYVYNVWISYCHTCRCHSKCYFCKAKKHPEIHINMRRATESFRTKHVYKNITCCKMLHSLLNLKAGWETDTTAYTTDKLPKATMIEICNWCYDPFLRVLVVKNYVRVTTFYHTRIPQPAGLLEHQYCFVSRRE